jgi:hypothetical protein
MYNNSQGDDLPRSVIQTLLLVTFIVATDIDS